ncbi:reprolysin family zinc metalloprotease [Ancylostoma caninum]|uniref:Reprolysin family zinc metalloprotease n=1 Tax=Ancylostoma caninum TaxID=29170 RepID=A0A368FX22_ANCCA|nr:reprolysin family zinc metalloprotease [Ancylostoma caninum]
MPSTALLLLPLLVVIHKGTVGVELRRKVKQGNVSFVRIQKYTNKTLPPIFNGSGHSLGLDILMMADYSTFQGFIEMSSGDTHMGQVYTLEYLRAVFEQVKTIYSDVEISKQIIQMNMAGTFVALREDDCPMLSAVEKNEADTDNSTAFDNSTVGLDFEETNSTEMTLSISAVKALDKFTGWLRKHRRFLPKHDHAILITKFDLLSPRGDSSTQGMAYVGNICQPGDSASIVEDVGAAATALIAAHELGHSLGAFHDGNPQSQECPSSANFLMAVTVSGTEDFERFSNSRVMSPCSIKSIEKNLKSPLAKCIWKPNSKSHKVLKKFSDPREMMRTPGELIGLRQQCQITFGPHYGVCPSKDYFRGMDVCRRIWCKDRTKRRSEPCETRTYFPALDGTECGRTKFHLPGNIPANDKNFSGALGADALTIQKGYRIGQPQHLILEISECVDVNPKTCKMYSKIKLRHYCKAKDFAEICCRSCSQLKDL